MKKTFLDFVEEQNNYREGLKVFESFKTSDIDKVIELINKVLAKHIKDKLIPLVGYAETMVGSKHCMSKQYLVIGKKPEDTQFFQLNWLIDTKSSEVYSIDFFKKADIYWYGRGKSDLTISTLGTSIVYLIPIIYTVVNTKDYNLSQRELKDIGNSVLGNGYLKESILKIDNFKYCIIENLSEKMTRDTFVLCEALDDDAFDFKTKKRQALDKAYKENDPNYSKLEDEYKKILNAIADGATTLDEIKVAIADRETVSVIQPKEEQKIEQEIETKRKDPEAVFKQMRHYISMVTKGIQSSLILCGAPGVGKTYNVTEQLKKAGYTIDKGNLKMIKGKCTARELYVSLYNYRSKNSIILVDDADSIVGPKAPEDCINILKGALDTTASDKGRLVTYAIATKITADDGTIIPKEFFYQGGIIIITNYNAGQLDTALRSRSFIQDINFTTEELLQIIRSKMKFIDPEHLSDHSKNKAYNFLEKLANSNIQMEISLRTFGSCARLYESIDEADEEMTEEDIEDMIMEQMRNLSARGGEKY